MRRKRTEESEKTIIIFSINFPFHVISTIINYVLKCFIVEKASVWTE